jgi:HIRAN domain-containing protein
VSFRDAFEAKARRGLAGGPVRLSFERRDWQADSESGAPLDGRGFVLLDGGRSLAWTSPRLAESGVEVLKVAGTSYRLEELQDPGFAPGSPVVLRPEPDNPHDPNAIGVWNAAGSAQAGFVPRESAAELVRRIASEPLEAFALWEWRDADGRRCGLRILIAPPEALAERPRPLLRREAGADESSLGSP